MLVPKCGLFSIRVALTLLLTLACTGCVSDGEQADDPSQCKTLGRNPAAGAPSNCAPQPGQLDVEVHGMVEYGAGIAGR
jgi:hypothetical protein